MPQFVAQILSLDGDVILSNVDISIDFSPQGMAWRGNFDLPPTSTFDPNSLPLGLTKSRGFAWPQVLCTGPVGIFSVVSRFDALERKCEKSLGVEVQIVRQPARRSDGFAIPRPDGLRCADRRNRL